MKVAIVCGHFVPEIGYLEVHLANACFKLGHEVQVFTSTANSKSVERITTYLPGLESYNGYYIQRINPILNFGQLVIGRSLNKLINDFNPHMTLVIGVGKVFPFPILKTNKFKLVTLFGDNEDSYNNTGNFARKIINITLRKLLKNPSYNRAVKHSDKIICYTPSTKQIVSSFIDSYLQSTLNEKCTEITLGFDSSVFYFNETERNSIRNSLKISTNHLVGITATRVTKNKNLEQLVDAICKVNTQNIQLNYILIGFMEDNYSNELKSYITSKNATTFIHCLSFMPHDAIRKYYSAADFGCWSNAAISIIEALGTGLKLLLPQKKNLSRLIHSSENGEYFIEHNFSQHFGRFIEDFNYQTATERTQVARKNKQLFDYDNIVKGIFDTLDK